MADYQVSVSLGGTYVNPLGGVAVPSGVYSVKAYGAAGDGVENDTVAIQAAVTACAAGGGGTVFFPQGTYNIASPFVEIPATAPITLLGDHAWLDGTDTADHAFVFDNGGGAGSPTFEMVEFRDLWFKRFTVRPVECSPYDASSRPTVTRLVVQGCRVTDAAYGFHFYCKIGSGLFADNEFTSLESVTADTAVCLFIGSKYDVDQTSTGNIIVVNNTINGLLAKASGSHLLAIQVFGYNVNISDNIITNVLADAGGADGPSSIGVKAFNVVISGNVIENGGGSNDGIIYVKGLGRGDAATGSNGAESYAIKITDNFIRSTLTEAWNATESGISVDGGSDGKDNIHISGNYVEGLRANGIKVEGSGGASDISIVNNQIYGTRKDYGIRYVSSGKRLTIKGNRIVGFGLDGTNSVPMGIRVDPVGALDVCEIMDNLVSDDGLAIGTGTVHGIYVVPTAGAMSRICIQNNTVDLQTTRTCTGLTAYVGGTGTLTTGTIKDNRVYVPAGQSAQVFAGSSSTLSVNGVRTAAADDATPTVFGASVLLIPANTGATAITQLDDAMPGQQVTLVATSATNPSTVVDGATFILAGSVSWTPGINDTITLFTANGGASAAWREVCRSDN